MYADSQQARPSSKASDPWWPGPTMDNRAAIPLCTTVSFGNRGNVTAIVLGTFFRDQSEPCILHHGSQ
jgi:hypothetical protein